MVNTENPAKTDPEAGSPFVYYEAENEEFRTAGRRSLAACTSYNDLPVDASPSQRIEAWKRIVDPEWHHTVQETLPGRGELASQDPTIFPTAPVVQPPIWMAHGPRLHVAPTAFIDRNCIMLDTPVADITIGEHVIIGPNVTIMTCGLGQTVQENSKRSTYGSNVTIGDCAWIGARSIITPGVTIGQHSIIGAGSVVVNDIPEYTVACGNPARASGVLKGTVRSVTDNTTSTRQEAPRASADNSSRTVATTVRREAKTEARTRSRRWKIRSRRLGRAISAHQARAKGLAYLIKANKLLVRARRCFRGDDSRWVTIDGTRMVRR